MQDTVLVFYEVFLWGEWDGSFVVDMFFMIYHALCPGKGTAGLKIILSKDYRLRELGIYIYSKNTGS